MEAELAENDKAEGAWNSVDTETEQQVDVTRGKKLYTSRYVTYLHI